MALIRPPGGDASGTATLLLAIADLEDNDFSAYDVATDTDDGLQFRVPDALADLYEAALADGPSNAEDTVEVEDEEEEAADEAPAAPVKRGPGRPRKNTGA